MSIETYFSENNTVLVIRINGVFDFALLNEFRKSYDDISLKSHKIVIDMRNTTTINSSALGMLLNMQRTLNKPDREIKIINCNEDVKKVFSITHFDKKFAIA